jgi:MFS family permease
MLVGIGLVCALVTLTIAVTNALGPEMQGLAAGLLNTSQQIGAALGASLASFVATSVVLALGNHGKAAVTAGFQVGIYLAGSLALLSGALAMLAIRTSPAKPTSSEQHPSEIHLVLIGLQEQGIRPSCRKREADQSMHSQTQDHALCVVTKLHEDEVPEGHRASPIKAGRDQGGAWGTHLLST